ncbi:MAG: polysaccharide deacetylase family protein [bacterium]|nr:polysaccharide deacetylase family protein [bacterium]
MNNHLKKIKISFSVAILSLIAIMIGGGFVMKDNNYFTGEQVSQTINYLKYKLSFAQTNNNNLTASALTLFSNSNLTIIRNDTAKSIPVLLYHGIVPASDRFSMTPEAFKNQMFALKRAGYETVKIEDFYDFINGTKDLPDKSFLLTFDDGRKDSYLEADPILRVLGYKAVMFAVTSNSLPENSKVSNYYLNRAELQTMINSGRWEIESHGKQESHNDKINSGFVQISATEEKGNFLSNLMWLPDEDRLETLTEYEVRLQDELAGSKKIFQDILGISVIAFAYPFDDFGQQSVNNIMISKELIKEEIGINYKLAFHQVWDNDSSYTFNYKLDNPLISKRIESATDWTGEELISYLEKGRDKSLPYADLFLNNNGWKKYWGSLNFSDNSLIIGARNSTTGSGILLDGSYLWQDYIVNTVVELTKGQTFSLLARYKDDKNYTVCSYSDKSIRAEQSVNGERKILYEWNADFKFIGKIKDVGIAVKGDVVDCYLDKQIAVRGLNLDKNLSHGGIGFKTWDPQMNNSELIIKSVSVEETK